MRTQLLGALALLCGGAMVHAQGWPTSAANGYYPRPSYQPTAYRQPGYTPYPVQGPYQGPYHFQVPTTSSNYVVPTMPAAPMMPMPEMPTAPWGAALSAAPPPPPEAAPANPAAPVAPAPANPTPATNPPAPYVPLSSLDFADEPEEPAGEPGPAERSGRDRFFVSADYLMLFLRPQRLPTPLATTGSRLDVHPGALGEPGTATPFGDVFDFGMFSGIQAEAGLMLDQNNRWSLNWSGLFVIPNQINLYKFSDSAGNPIITRPVFNVLPGGGERAFLDSFPGLAAGGLTIDAQSELFGTEITLQHHFNAAPRFHADALLGFRYLRLAESLTIQDQFQPLSNDVLTFLGAFVNAPNTLADMDSFQTTNNFYGPQVGGRLLWEKERLFVSVFGKVALGATAQQVSINGASVLLTPAGSQSATGGILALPSNIGRYNRTVLGFVPEGGLNVGVKVTRHVQILAGYSFLFWNQVARPASQIDRFVNPNMIPTDSSFTPQVTGPARPSFHFVDEYFWAHTINCGVCLHF